jgi:hypothetical protein
MLTYNQILKRIQQVSQSHAQVRNYNYGRPTDFLTEKSIHYVSVFLQDNDGSLSIGTKQQNSAFKLFVLDLVNASEDTLSNIKDVQSDCLEIAKDIISMLDDDVYQDWALGSECSYTLLFEAFGDMVAGCVVDFNIRTPYLRDRCAVPII